MEVKEDALQLKMLIQGVYHIHQPHAWEKEIHLTYEIDPQLPAVIRSDRTKLNETLINLVGNAIKFTPNGNKVHLKATQAQQWLVLQVVDEGIGIPADKQSLIFEAFEQIDSSSTKRFTGSGLGLVVVKHLVELLNGTITIESLPSKGTTFTVHVPLKAISEERPIDYDKDDAVSFSPENQVLLIEDNTMNQDMLHAWFRQLGLSLLVESHGQAGIEKIKECQKMGTPLDLVLMDMHMPGMDGLEASQQIRELPGGDSLPIVALTADAFTNQQRVVQACSLRQAIQKLMKLCDRFDSPYLELLQSLEKAVFDGNEPQFQQLLRQALEKSEVMS